MLAKGLREPEFSLVNSQSFSLLFLVHGCLLSFFFLLSPSFSSSFVLGSKITAAIDSNICRQLDPSEHTHNSNSKIPLSSASDSKSLLGDVVEKQERDDVEPSRVSLLSALELEEQSE